MYNVCLLVLNLCLTTSKSALKR